MKDSWDYDQLERFLESRIVFSGVPNTIQSRIDFLESLAAVLRHRHTHLEQSVRYEEFLQCVVTANDRIVCATPERMENLGSGTAPALLQPDLLIFLMLYDRQEYRVLDIIERFIKHPHVKERLKVLDFKKTETGVIRCFTNTRFAAKTLRQYGFLRFTRVEAYKTWRLTLSGFVTAAVLLRRQGARDWREPNKNDPFPLHLEIRDTWEQIQDFDSFVEALASVCEPNIELFRQGESVLRHAYELLRRYWQALRNKKFNAADRQRLCHENMEELEHDPDIDAFKQEFSSCVMVDNLLESLGKGEKKG